jgi:predicted transcriptional regulator
MSQMTLRLPESLHKSLKEMAEKENVSANQFVALAVAEKISALMTSELLEQRAARAPDRKRFEELLAKVPEREPDEEDRL